MFRDISAWHVVLILVVFVVLFGYKKLPDATRSLGRSMRIFKSEIKGLHDDEPRPVESTPVAAQPQAPPQAQPTVPPTAQPTVTPPAQPSATSHTAPEARAEADRS